jgi:hypothetical protein
MTKASRGRRELHRVACAISAAPLVFNLSPSLALAQTEDPVLLHSQLKKNTRVCSANSGQTTRQSCEQLIIFFEKALSYERGLPDQAYYIRDHKRLSAEIRSAKSVLATLPADDNISGPQIHHGAFLQSDSKPATAQQNDFWSGAETEAVCAYLGTGGSCSFDRITQVTGAVVVPSPVDQSSSICLANNTTSVMSGIAESASGWLGIGGDASLGEKVLIQAGVDVRSVCNGHNTGYFTALPFYEAYPFDKTEQLISMTVNKGDVLNVSVTLNCSFNLNTGQPGSGTATYTVVDTTSNPQQTSGQIQESVALCPIASAEAISERHCGANSLQKNPEYCDAMIQPNTLTTKFLNVMYTAETDGNSNTYSLGSSATGTFCSGYNGSYTTCTYEATDFTVQNNCDLSTGSTPNLTEADATYMFEGMLTNCTNPAYPPGMESNTAQSDFSLLSLGFTTEAPVLPQRAAVY